MEQKVAKKNKSKVCSPPKTIRAWFKPHGSSFMKSTFILVGYGYLLESLDIRIVSPISMYSSICEKVEGDRRMEQENVGKITYQYFYNYTYPRGKRLYSKENNSI